jgi:hypothetical protein
LYGASILGADLTASLGAHFGSRFSLYGDLKLLFGSAGGLPVRQFRVGPSVDYEAFPRVHLGAGLSVGGTSITRATTGETLNALSIGLRVMVSVDLWKEGEHAAIYLLGELSVDSAGTFLADEERKGVDATLSVGPTIGVGGRF